MKLTVISDVFLKWNCIAVKFEENDVTEALVEALGCWWRSRVTLHTTEPTCTQPSIMQHTTGHRCPVVCHHFREHGRRGQRYKRLFRKQIFGQQSISDLKAQFVARDYLHNVSHIIWLIMNRNRKACLAYVNNVCLCMLGCVHCARLCVSARLCAFLLGCVLCLVRLVLVIDGRTVFHDIYHSNYLYHHD